MILLHQPNPPGLGVNETIPTSTWAGICCQGAPVPEIYDYGRGEGWLLLEDLGDISLEAAIKKGRPGRPRGGSATGKPWRS